MIRVLVSNDDGINAPGIHAMVRALSRHAEVYVAAPSQQQSAKARAHTFNVPFAVLEAEMEGATAAYAVDGTPADCVLWGIHRYRDEFNFDYVFSGINHGINAGLFACYSGTLAAALEGTVNGVRAIAMSVQGHDAKHFDYICSLIPELMNMSDRLPVDTLLSVNAPDLPAHKIKGVKFVGIRPLYYNEGFRIEETGDGRYIMKANAPSFDCEKDDCRTDFSAVGSGYIAVSPIRAELNDPDGLARLQGLTTAGSICVFLNVQNKKLEDICGNPDCSDRMEYFRDRLARFARCAGRLEMPVLVVNQYDMGRAVDEVTVNLGKHEVVEKDGLNLFSSEEFSELIATSREKKAVLAGVETYLEIRSAAKQLQARGFEVTVLEDCCLSGSEDSHRITIENLRAEGCIIENLETYMVGYVEETHHPAKRRIREILNAK